MNDDLTPQQKQELHLQQNAREARRIAACYKSAFESDAGRVVMADLLAHFDPEKSRFSKATEFDLVPAALIDGQAAVMKHIKDLIRKANEN